MVDTTDVNSNWVVISPGYSRLELFHNAGTKEIVRMESLKAGGGQIEWEMPPGGQEIYVVSGSLSLSNTKEPLSEGSWVRHPASTAGQTITVSTSTGARFYLKSGHLTITAIS